MGGQGAISSHDRDHGSIVSAESVTSKPLLQRLRWEIEHPDTSGTPYVNDEDLLAECLVEIERLRRDAEIMWKDNQQYMLTNDRLRAALERIEAYPRELAFNIDHRPWLLMAVIAREALAGTDDETGESHG